MRVVKGPAPSAVMELAEAMAGFAYGEAGELVPISTRQRIAVEDRVGEFLREGNDADDWTDLLREVLRL